MLNPVQLKTLAVVIETGSFANAARRLGYTASAVSQQVVALERATGACLFEREAHSARPTAAAHLLAERTGDVLKSLEALELDARSMAQGRTGRVRLGSFPTGSARLLPGSLAALVRARPGVEVLLDEGEPDELLPLLLEGRLDVALVYRYDLVPRPLPEGLVETPLVDEDLLLLLPTGHPRATRRPIRLGELADESWVASREGTDGASCLLGLCAAAGFVPRIDLRSNDYGVVQGLVAAGLGIALVPALGHDPTADVHASRLAGRRRQRHVSAMHRSTNSNPLVVPVLGALREAGRSVQGRLAGVRPGPASPPRPRSSARTGARSAPRRPAG